MPKKKKPTDVDRLFPGFTTMDVKPNPKFDSKAKKNAIELGKKNITWEKPHR